MLFISWDINSKGYESSRAYIDDCKYQILLVCWVYFGFLNLLIPWDKWIQSFLGFVQQNITILVICSADTPHNSFATSKWNLSFSCTDFWTTRQGKKDDGETAAKRFSSVPAHKQILLCGARLLIAPDNPQREGCAILSTVMTDECGEEPTQKE